MPAPQPKDPLDDLIAEFVRSVNEYLAFKLEDIPKPEQIESGNPFDDLKKNWEEAKRHIQKIYTVMVGARPEVDQRLQRILAVGAAVCNLTDDEYIVKPVEAVQRMVSEERRDIERITTRMGKADSVGTVFTMVLEMAGIGSRSEPRREEILRERDSLVAYYSMRTPPPESA